MLKKLFIILSIFSLTFAVYNVGQTVSISDQQQVLDICNGEEPNGETDEEMTMYDYNGAVNGGSYHVFFIDLSATW